MCPRPPLTPSFIHSFIHPIIHHHPLMMTWSFVPHLRHSTLLCAERDAFLCLLKILCLILTLVTPSYTLHPNLLLLSAPLGCGTPTCSTLFSHCPCEVMLVSWLVPLNAATASGLCILLQVTAFSVISGGKVLCCASPSWFPAGCLGLHTDPSCSEQELRSRHLALSS